MAYELELESESEEYALEVEDEPNEYTLEVEGEGEYTLELECEPEEYTLEVENEVVVAKGGDTPTPTVDTAVALIEGTITEAKYETVKTVRNYAFSSCTSLTSVDLPQAATFGNYAFSGCTSLTSVDLPQATTFGSSAFQGCTSLTSVDLPQATTFGSSAFQGCKQITRITLPKVQKINGQNFCYNCSALTAFVIENTEQVCSLTSTSNCFANTPIRSGTGYIYVPDALVDSYKTATNWVTFADQIKPLSELPAEA
jgi:hypothetical protein